MGLILLGATAPAARAEPAWTVGRTNVSGVNQITGLAYGNGRFVACTGGSGAPGAVYSSDGTTWNAATTALPPQGSIAFVAGAFYLAADTGVWRSPDGVAWSEIYTGTQTNRTIASDGKGLLIGSSNINATAALYSPDLAHWTLTAPLPAAASSVHVLIQRITFAFGRYFVAYQAEQSNGSLLPLAASTRDGTTWTAEPALAGAIELAAGDGRLVARISDAQPPIATSTDGVTYARTTSPALSGSAGVLGFAGGRFMFTGSLYTSLDGVTWTSLASAALPTNSSMVAVAYGNGRYVVAGYAGNSGGPGGTVDVLASLSADAPPLISNSTGDQTVAIGSPLTLPVTVDNADSSTRYQWRHDGTPVSGATASTLTIAAVSTADAGGYTCEVTNALGTVSTEVANVTVVPLSQASRIVNLSVLTPLDSPDDQLTASFVVAGTDASATKQLLVRGGGPSLAKFGVSNPDPDPRLEFFSRSTKTAENDNWAGTQPLQDLISSVSAFPFDSGDSRDAALSVTVPNGNYSARISDASGGTGYVIAEVYDTTQSATVTASTPRLVNVSAMKTIAGGADLTAGFVITGATTKTVLVRAIGPGLAQFGVTAPMPDPTLLFYRRGESTPIATNDNWNGDAQLKAVFKQVAAFDLADGSTDAALVVTLPAGDYTARATGVAGGTVLVEVYDVP